MTVETTRPGPRHRSAESPSVRGIRPTRRSAVEQQRLVRHSTDRQQPARHRRAVVAGTALALVAGSTVAVGVSQAAGPNLVLNPGFETGLDGWFSSSPFTLERVSPGRDSDYAVRVSNAGATARTGALNDTANTVATTVAGHTYRARAWVKADVAGRRLAVRLMEYKGTTYLGEKATASTVSDTGWHKLVVQYTAKTDGASLDLNVVASGLPVGASVFVDDLRLTDQDGGAAATPAAPAPATTTTTEPAPAPTTTEPSAPTTAGSGTSTSASAEPSTSTTTSTSTAPRPTTSTTTAAPAKPPAGWNLVWNDEFDGGALDTSAWTAQNLSTFGDGNNELACLMDRPQNLFVSGGALTLRARSESSPVQCGSSDSRFPGGRKYTSAMIRTKDAWTYGRFEIRAKLPIAAGESKGLWPAFWLRPSAGGTGELDVLEAVGSSAGGDTSDRIHHTIWYDYSGTYPKQAYQAKAGFDASAGWHTYATEWEPGEIRWYIDGRLTYSRSTSTTSWLDKAFAKPFFVRLNLAVGGSWPGSPDASTSFPADYQVDYLRVYQR